MKKQAAPIIAAILLLLPVLYVGSYFALVMPGGSYLEHYRAAPRQCSQAFWPLEQLDRRIRPDTWAWHEQRKQMVRDMFPKGR